MRAPLWARKDFWKQIHELEAELARVVEETEKVAQEARLALAELPALRDSFDAFLHKRLIVWGSHVRQLIVDLFPDPETEARTLKESSNALENQAEAGAPLSSWQVGGEAQ
jgi:hypothetical protein